MKKTTRFVSLLICMAILLSMFAGCGGSPVGTTTAGSTQETTVSTTAATREVMSYTLFNWGFEDITKEDKIVKYFEDKFNIKMELKGATFDEAPKTLDLLIASGDIPDLFQSKGPGDPAYERIVKEDIALDVTDMVGNYPNLNRVLSDETVKFMKTNKRLFGIPRINPTLQAHGVTIRKDWLDELGLAVPKTYDELYDVLKAFVEKDPDGTKNIGLTLFHPWFFIHFFAAYTGSAGWGLENDRYVQTYTLPSYKDGLKYLNKLYKEKLLDPDYLLGKVNSDWEKFNSGRAGAIIDQMGLSWYGPSEETLKKTYPDAELLTIAPPLTGPAGAYMSKQAVNYWMMSCISSQTKSPERLLELYDYFYTDEGTKLLAHGIEGVHYTMDGDKVVRNDAAYKAERPKYDSNVPAIHGFADLAGYGIFSVDYFAPISENDKIILATKKILNDYGVADKAPGFAPSEENAQNVATIKDIVDTYQAKFITGDLDIDAKWDEYLQKLKDAGYTALEEDVNNYMKQYK